jgi:replicative DNA helicase
MPNEIPQAIDAEKAFLSCVIQNISILNEAADHASPKLFFHPDHKRIFESALELWKEGKDCDLVTLTDHMMTAGTLDMLAGGAAILTEAFLSPAVTSNWQSYLEILRHKHTARLAISAAERIIDSANNPAMAGELSEVVQKALVAVAADAESKGRIESLKEVALNRINTYEQIFKNRGKLIGIPTGFKQLDDITGGFREGQLIVIGAATKGGKTSMAVNMATRVANGGIPVGVISLEMSSGELFDRVVSSYGGVDISVLSKQPTKQEMDKISQAASQASILPIFIRDEGDVNPLQLRAAMRRMCAVHHTRLIVVDYIQLLSPTDRKDSRERQVAEASRTLKQLAKELGITIIALTQLNADGASRESRAIEHDCDLFLVIEREQEKPFGWFLNIRLARACAKARIPLEFRESYMRFDEP